MKVTIELTKEQISKLIEAETASLLTTKETAIKQAEKVYDDEVAKLEKKWKTYGIETGETGEKSVNTKLVKIEKQISSINAKLWKVRKTGDTEEITKLENKRNELNESKKLLKK